jgi:dihydroorotate dehydrogenase electron transfer subunit
VSSNPKVASPPRQRTTTLVARREVAPGYHVLEFELSPSDAPIRAIPGHFAMVRGASWGTSPLLPRPMSLLTDGARPSILIKVVGEATARMARAVVGEPYELLAPLGVPFDVEGTIAEKKRPILVAGGVGVVPLIFLARAFEAKGVRPLSLYGGRTKNDLPLDDALAAAGDLEISTDDGSRGTKGRVTVLLERMLDDLRDQVVVFTCGPTPMMRAVSELCERAGVACIASLEAPMGCGYGVCLGCNVPKRADLGGGYLYVCNAGPCVDGTHVDWENFPKLH